MPIQITQTQPKPDVPFAQSPEFQQLQQAIAQAKESLDDISRQIVAIETKLKAPQPTKTPQPDQKPTDAQGMAGSVRSSPNTPSPPPNPNGGSFEESIAEMRRIAGLR
jgi:hypothetical protein